MAQRKSAQRSAKEKDIQAAGDLVGILSEMEEAGFCCLGTLSQAARKGYYTARVCASRGQCVGPEEVAEYCAVMADCPTDLCLVDEDGNRVRPCLPVYPRTFPQKRG